MRYRFGDYCLDTQRYELHRGRVPIPLQPKVYQVLAYLLTHADRVVLKQELLEHVWPGQFVGDAALNSYIMSIRKALGDDGHGQRLVRTVRGRGYRVVAPVAVQDPVPLAPPSRLVPSPTGETAASTAPPPALPAEPLPAADPAGPAADGEHKLVTILCGTLAEAPALATQLGPERWYRLLQTVVGLAQEVLQHYAGTLTLASNDGFTTVFGMPVAQEDHARRAVLAALELRQRLHDAPALRAQLAGGLLTLGMGLHSGLVVVGGLGLDPPRLATAVGAPLHLATRLQQQAAVVGMQLTWPLLQAVTGLADAALHTGLTHLQAAAFLDETQVVPELTYTFTHALTHEVAYNSLLLERRRGLHARLVEVLEALASDGVAEPVERLAHHALRGEV